MFASTLFVRMRTNSQYLRIRYSYVCVKIARLCLFSIRAYADE